MTLRVSPSLLEEFRLTCLGKWGKNAETLRGYVQRKLEPTEAMARGQCYHNFLEFGTENYYNPGDKMYHAEDRGFKFKFTQEAVQPAIDIREKYQAMTHEIKHTFWADVMGAKIKMNMRVDGMDGLRIEEFKTTGRKPSFNDYYDSMQWRCYALGFSEVNLIRYHFFQLNRRNTSCTYSNFTIETSDKNRAFEWLERFVTYARQDEAILNKIKIED